MSHEDRLVDKMQWRIQEARGIRIPPSSSISFVCIFWQHFWQIIGWRIPLPWVWCPPYGNPGHATEMLV